MEFNINKYRVIHIWKRNLEFQYQINDWWVKSIEEERGKSSKRKGGEEIIKGKDEARVREKRGYSVDE